MLGLIHTSRVRIPSNAGIARPQNDLYTTRWSAEQNSTKETQQPRTHPVSMLGRARYGDSTLQWIQMVWLAEFGGRCVLPKRGCNQDGSNSKFCKLQVHLSIPEQG